LLINIYAYLIGPQNLIKLCYIAFSRLLKHPFHQKKKVNKDEHCMTTLTNCLRGWKWMGFAGGWCKDSGWTSRPEPKSNLQVK